MCVTLQKTKSLLTITFNNVRSVTLFANDEIVKLHPHTYILHVRAYEFGV